MDRTDPMRERVPLKKRELVLRTTPWWRRWMLFQSWRQAWMYARVAVPAIGGLAFLLHHLLVGGVLADAGEARAILIGALAGSLMHLLCVFPSTLQVKGGPESRRIVHRFLAGHGWEEDPETGEFRYRHRQWTYPESRVWIERRSGCLFVHGPELLLRRLARALRRESGRDRGRRRP